MLEALNRAVLAESRPGQFLTAIFARLRRGAAAASGSRWPAAGTRRRWCRRRRARRARSTCSGTLLGVLDDPRVADTTVDLEPGDTLLLYTDGLTEAGAPAAHADHGRGRAAAGRRARRDRRADRRRPASRARSRRAAGSPATTSPYSWSRSRSPALDRRENPPRESSTRGQCSELGARSETAASMLFDRGGSMRRTRWAAGLGAGLLALLAVPGAALADGNTLDLANAGKLPFEVGINSVWVLVAGILVMFMQAGFAFLEIGFSRGKNAGTVIAKILVNFSICAICFWAVGFAFAFGDGNQIIGTSGFFLAGAGRQRELPAGQRRRGHGHGRDAVVLPVRLLRRLAGDRLGHDARARQVRRLRDLRDRLLVAHLPDRRPLDLRRRLARHAVRRAGLRRLDGGPPDRRHRRARGAAAARPASRQVRRRTASRGRSRATTCRCSASAS